MITRDPCPLCDTFKTALLADISGKMGLTIADIDSNPRLKTQFDTRVPVLLLGDHVVCEARYQPERLRRAIEGSL
ncbi:MAG: glutaredoxin family protein [Pseudomonadota bacterium]